MNIRHYRPEDKASLEAITDVCFADVSIDKRIETLCGRIAGKSWQWRKRREVGDDIRAHAEGVFVAEDGGAVVGYITTSIDRDERIGHIANFAVLPSHQKQGAGSRLIAAALRHLADAGMEHVRIETLAHNDVGMHFYPKLGFKEMARQVHFIMPLAEGGGGARFPGGTER